LLVCRLNVFKVVEKLRRNLDPVIEGLCGMNDADGKVAVVLIQ
jgi:hypothetical protein